MASSTDKLSPFKNDAAKNNHRSPLNDPFFAESLIIQSKSIVGRMYSANEYVRFKYENELNQLVKEYRVWLAEIKREEREVAGKLDILRREQREMSKERHDFAAIQLVAKSNREFIDHYKRRRTKANTSKRSLLNNPLKLSSGLNHPPKLACGTSDPSTKGSGKFENVIRLPKIVEKVDEVKLEVTKTTTKTTQLPFLASQKENRPNTSVAPTKAKVSDKFLETKRATGVSLKQGELSDTEEIDSLSKTKALTPKAPRVLSAPKSRRERRIAFEIPTARPSSACQSAS